MKERIEKDIDIKVLKKYFRVLEKYQKIKTFRDYIKIKDNINVNYNGL